MEKIINKVKYWGQIFLLPLYWLSFLTPRDKKIWLFGSTFGYSFSGNPKYLYLYIKQYQNNSVRPIWISRDRKIVKLLTKNGYESYYVNSLRGIYYCLRGSVYVFDNYSKDVSFWMSGAAVKVNLYHGVFLKKINFDNKFDKVRHPKNKWEKISTYLRRMTDEKPHHYILSISDIITDVLISSFKTTRDHILTCGYPRNDILINNNFIKNLYSIKEKRSLSKIKQHKNSGYKILYYMPTFRASETMFFDIVDIDVLNTFLKDNNYMFYIKLHIKSKLHGEFSKIKHTNIVNIDSEVDINSFLRYSDILITDYSSVYIDYLMCNKPIIFFPYDYEIYLKNEREFNFNYYEYTPGIKVYNIKELISGIIDVSKYDDFESERLSIRRKIFQEVDDLSSKRLYESILKIIS